jgi:hypothetical protein
LSLFDSFSSKLKHNSHFVIFFRSDCPYVNCDFSALVPGVLLTSSSQQAAILAACGITNIFADNGRKVNVFNSSVVTQDPDLGSPNQACPGGGPGVGAGGGPTTEFPNCKAQGNLLIIQNPLVPANTPNDAADGGCITIEFARGIELANMGLLDLEEDNSEISVSTIL